MKTKTKPPKSTLPLKWKDFNGCREMDRETVRENIKLAPLDTFDAWWSWLHDLSYDDRWAWFESVGWPEGGHYCANSSYAEHTAYPGLIRDRDRDWDAEGKKFIKAIKAFAKRDKEKVK